MSASRAVLTASATDKHYMESQVVDTGIIESVLAAVGTLSMRSIGLTIHVVESIGDSAAGNKTAVMGKGLTIRSVLMSLPLFSAHIIPYWFSAMTMGAVRRTADVVKSGKLCTPGYTTCIDFSTVTSRACW